MGLDMYAYEVKMEDVVDDFSVRKDSESNEIAYWRKHHDLHGWMEELYREKGGVGVFNCAKVRLESKDLDRLEATLHERCLPRTTGFFYGNNPPDDESNKRDFKFIRDARRAISDGLAVYYDSWW